MANKKNAIWIIVGIAIVLLVALNWGKINKQSFTATPICGDLVCDSNENCSTCPSDCGACNCVSGQQSYAICGDAWSYQWATKQCINNQWVIIQNVNPCYCSDDTYCNLGYHCINNVCSKNNPTFCQNTGNCTKGFYCNENHTCSSCPSTYSLFSIYDCEFSSGGYACQDANSCYNLAKDYCSQWLCQSNSCVKTGLRYADCCSDLTPCETNQTCVSHTCQDIVPTPAKKTSPLNVIITLAIIGGLAVGGYLLYKKNK